MQQKVAHARIVKILDDFLFIGDSKNKCREQLEQFKNLCSQINLPLAHHKTVDPCRELEFLGLVLNTVDMVAKLPVDKVARYASSIETGLDMTKISLTELKSMIGKLQFATSAIKGGRAFLRRLYDLTINVQHGHYKIRLNSTVKRDLRMLLTFLNEYNGITIIKRSAALKSPDVNLYSDASLTGFGATFNDSYITGIFPKSEKNIRSRCSKLTQSWQ